MDNMLRKTLPLESFFVAGLASVGKISNKQVMSWFPPTGTALFLSFFSLLAFSILTMQLSLTAPDQILYSGSISALTVPTEL